MKILELQGEMQRRYAAERGMVDPCEIETVGQFIDYIREMREYLNMELEEILAAVDYTGACRKPWKERHDAYRKHELLFADYDNKLQHEAIDALCFMMNICLACGVTEDNIERLYSETHTKNTERLDGDY